MKAVSFVLLVVLCTAVRYHTTVTVPDLEMDGQPDQTLALLSECTLALSLCLALIGSRG